MILEFIDIAFIFLSITRMLQSIQNLRTIPGLKQTLYTIFMNK